MSFIRTDLYFPANYNLTVVNGVESIRAPEDIFLNRVRAFIGPKPVDYFYPGAAAYLGDWMPYSTYLALGYPAVAVATRAGRATLRLRFRLDATSRKASQAGRATMRLLRLGLTASGVAASGSTAFTEPFTGADGTVWDSTRWVLEPGGGSIVLSGNTGRMTTAGLGLNAAGAVQSDDRGYAMARWAPRVDEILTGTFRWSAANMTGAYTVLARSQAATEADDPRKNAYGLRLLKDRWLLVRIVNSSFVTLGTVQTVALATSAWQFKLETIGSTVRAKVWADGAAEPGAWSVTVTEAAGDLIANAGRAAISMANGADAVASAMHFDSFTLAGTATSVSVPAAPTLSGTVTNGDPVLTWTQPANTASYVLQRRASGGTFADYETISSATTLTSTDAAATPGTTYDYRIYARNTAGTSPASATVILTATNPTTPPGPKGRKIMDRTWIDAEIGTKGTFSESECVALARKHDTIVVQQNTIGGNGVTAAARKAIVAKMRTANPRVKILVYENASYMQKTEGPGTNPNVPAAWYYTHNDNGTDYLRSAGFGNYLMRLRLPNGQFNTGWIVNRVAAARSIVSALDADGVFLDMLGPATVQGAYVVANYPTKPAVGGNVIDPDTGAPYTEANWLHETALVAKGIKQGTGYYVSGNGAQGGQSYVNQGHILVDEAAIDSLCAESYLRGAGQAVGTYEPESSWVKNRVMFDNAAGVAILGMTKLWPDAMVIVDATEQAYSDAFRIWHVASTLLFATKPYDAATYYESKVGNPHITPAWYDAQIGVATTNPPTARVTAGGPYQRLFDAGAAAANPGTATKSWAKPDADKDYTDAVTGTAVTWPVSMPGNTAKIVIEA